MRDLATKVDSSSSLTAGEFNSSQTELENAVTRAGITPDSGAGPDSDLFMLARAMTITAQGGISYQDNGAANSFVLAAVQTFEQPTAYIDGETVSFSAAATNTGACTINRGGLGAIAFTKAGGTAFTAGEIVAGNIIVARYFQSTNRYEEVSNTTPEASGPAAPDQIAVYADSGTVSQITLTIEPGYIQPSAFTDQMVVIFKAAATNNGAGTHPVNITGLGARDVVEKDGSNPVAGRIQADDWVKLVFREVRDAFEIATVTINPQAPQVLACDISSSSGTVFNLSVVPPQQVPLTLRDGQIVIFRAPQTNTGSVDINLADLGLRDLRNASGANFASGDIDSGALIIAQYIASEDRFRAFNGSRVDLEEVFQAGRSAYTITILNPSFNANQTTTLNWGTPVYDDLGFYNAISDSFEVPSGVTRIDVSCGVVINAGTDDTRLAELLVDGQVVARQSAGGAILTSCNLSILDLPVSAGQLIEVRFQTRNDVSSPAARTATGFFQIRASQFA